MKFALVAIMLGTALSLIPYLIVYSSTGGNMFGTSGPFFDDFESQTLNSRWKFVDPLGNSSLDLSTRQGWLTMTTYSLPNRGIADGPRLVLSDITGDFLVRTRVQLSSASPNGSAGIIIWRDSEDYVYLYDTLDLGNTIIFGETRVKVAQDARASNYRAIDLILSKRGGNFTASYIFEGIEFQVDTLSFTVTGPLDVGVSIASTHGGSFSASFDFLSLAPY